MEPSSNSNNVRKVLKTTAIAACAALLASCGSGAGDGSDGGGDGGSGDRVTLQGTFSGGSQTALVAEQVLKASFFTQDGGHVESVVTGGTFSLKVEKGTPGGLVFLGGDDRFLGYLTLGDGIDSLPLNRLGDGVTDIDFGILSSIGSLVEADHNPIGVEFPLSGEEREAIALADDFFASLVKSPDVDGDGVPDFLQGLFFRLMILYFINGGNFGSGLTPALNPSASISGYKLALDARDADRPETVSFTGPSGSGLAASVSDQKNALSTRTTYFSPFVSVPVLPPEGAYDVGYESATFRFEVPDQTSAPTRVVLPVPTVTLNGDGTIQKVVWVYRLGSGAEATLEPLSLIDGIEVQIEGSGSPCASYPQSERIYNSGELSASTTEHTLTCQTLLWGDVSRLHMAYDDVYGNHNVVTWAK